jgi:hypothetical protein
MPYVFRHGYVRITARGFPHSEIPGSKVVQHLTGAYRSRPRPSSTPGAKASTNGSYYLDRKNFFVTLQFSRFAPAYRHIRRPKQRRSRVFVPEAETELVSPRPRQTGSLKTEQDEAVRVRPRPGGDGDPVVDIEF